MSAIQATIDEKMRVRFPPSAVEGLEWKERFLAGAPVLVAMGPENQIKVLEKGPMDRIREGIESSLDHSDEISDKVMLWLRSLDAMVELKPSIEKTRVTLTIPRELRRANSGFEVGNQVMIFARKKEFEIWDLAGWTATTAVGVKQLAGLTDDDIEALK